MRLYCLSPGLSSPGTKCGHRPGLSLWGWNGQATSVYTLGLLDPKLPGRDGSVLCLRSVAFLRQMRTEDEGHLKAAPLEKAFRQLCPGSGRKQQVVFTLLPGGTSGSGGGDGVGGTHLCWYVCQVLGDPGHLPSCVPSFWWGSWKVVWICRPSGRFADPLSSSTGLLLEVVFFSMALNFLPGRPPPLARMGWRPCKGLRES